MSIRDGVRDGFDPWRNQHGTTDPPPYYKGLTEVEHWRAKGLHVGLRWDDPLLAWAGNMELAWCCAERFGPTAAMLLVDPDFVDYRARMAMNGHRIADPLGRHVVAWLRVDEEPWPNVICAECFTERYIDRSADEMQGVDDQRDRLRKAIDIPPESDAADEPKPDRMGV